MTVRVSAILLAAALAVAGCATSPSPQAPADGGSAGGIPARSAAPTAIPLAARPVVSIVVGGRAMRVVAADDEASWEQGLQGVPALGDLDGMLFRFHATLTRAFWMKDTLLPLDVAFFDASGRFVSVMTMPLCRSEPCPTYAAAAPYATALEARAGSLGFLRAGDRLAEGPAASPSR